MVHIEVTGPVPDLNWWKELTGLYLRETLGQEFSIHCWKDEEQEIQLALGYGVVHPSDWAFGTEISGPVTEPFLSFLLDQSQVLQTGPDGGAQMTPFFGIFLGSTFSSSHYGREVDIQPLQGSCGAALDALLEELKQKDWVTIYEYEG